MVCLGLTGTAVFYILKNKKKSTDPEVSEGDVALPLKTHKSFELKPVVKRSHKEIGEEYYQLSTIARDEAQDVFRKTGHLIVFQKDQKKMKYVIGRGRFGAIKVAQRIEDGQYVASKKVKGEENMRLSEAEANMQRDAAGSNVLPIYNTIKLDEALYHFMPLAGFGDGNDIQAQLASLNNPKLSLEILKFIAKDILIGLKTIHAKGVYHLDLKPDNVVFANDGAGYLTDFGCAKKTTGTNMPYDSIGDNRYFSPERFQAIREKSTFDAEKTDIWAAGMMLLQMIKDLSPLQVFEMPDNFGQRLRECDQKYFDEKLKQFEELQDPDDWDIWWVIKGMLDPNPKTRFTAKHALKASCFEGLNAKTKAPIFEDMRAEKLVQATGKSRDEIDLRNYHHVSAALEDEKRGVYDSCEHQKHYRFDGFTRDIVSSGEKKPKKKNLASEYV